MATRILLIEAYLLLVILGAEAVVCATARIAKRLRMSEFMLGMVIIGFGTSLPELVVSVMGSIEGHSDISVGNIVGSNIFNVFAILGLCAAIWPIRSSERNRWFDLPMLMLVTVFALCVCLFGNDISRCEGIAMLVLMGIYLLCSSRLFDKGGRGDSAQTTEPDNDAQSVFWGSKKREKVLLSVMVIGGLAILLVGGYLLVNESIAMAQDLGMSERVISILLLAIGTSLPELVTAIASARRGMTQMVLGNIIGSNTFNLLFVLGLSATIRPLSACGMQFLDWLMLGASIPLLYLFVARRPHKIKRWHGVVMVALMAAYLTAMILWK